MISNFKKCFSLLLVFLLIFNLAACSSTKNTVKEENKKEVKEEVKEEIIEEEAKVPEIDLWITSQTYDPVRYEAGLMIANAWKQLGFEVKTTALEWATMSSEGMKAHKHDAFMIQWGGKAERIDPFHWLYSLHNSSEAAEGGYNVAGYENPEYDKLAEEFASNMDWEVRKQKAYKMQEILSHDVPQPPLVHRKLTMAYNKSNFENAVMAMGEGLYSFWNWVNITPKGDRDIIRFGTVSDLKLLNPLTTKTGQDIYMLRLIYDPLIRIDKDGKPIPWAAESYKSIDDKTIEVVLRDGMKFHDGKPVTAEDVKFTFDFAREVKSPYYLSKLKKLDTVEKVDDKTLRFVLKEPFAPFISNGLALVGILPKHIWEKEYEERGPEGILSWENLPAVGSGPYKFDYWRPNEEFKLNSFDEHFNAPKAKGILRIPYAQTYGVVQGLKSGEIDVAGLNLLPLQIEELKDSDFLAFDEIDDQGYYMLHYNMRKAPFNDVDVRRALTYSIPKDQIIELVFGGRAVPAYSTVAAVNKFWHNENIEKIGNNMEKARETLKEAGFRWDKEGKIYFPKDYKVKGYYSDN